MNDGAPVRPPAFHPGWLPTEPERMTDTRTTFGGIGLPAPMVHDVGERALRQRELNFAAKRLVDIAFVSGFDWPEALSRLRWRGVPPAGPVDFLPLGTEREPRLQAASDAGAIVIEPDLAGRRVRLTWTDPALGAPVVGGAAAPRGWGGIVTGGAEPHPMTAQPIPRAAPSVAPWPLGNGVAKPEAASAALDRAVAHLFARSPGAFGLLVAAPDRVLFEHYAHGGAPDRPTPSWSMNKSMTGTMIGRMLHLGWLENVHAPAPAPAWRDPRGTHALVTLDHLMRMRGGLAMACIGEEGAHAGFEGGIVYHDAADAFAAAQACFVVTRPGAVFRYCNAGMNVLAAIIRDRIEARDLPYHATLYELLADRLGMSGYEISADIAGNLIGSGSAFATLRDWGKLGVLYLQDGVWNGERLLPEGWADHVLTATEAGTSYGATFWTNADRRFPSLPPDAAWMLGSGEQRVFILRGAKRVVAVTNETDMPMDLDALDAVLAVVMREA